jgi:type IV pilus assembly protein PilC
LRRDGIQVNKVKKKSKSMFAGANKKPILTSDISIFARQLATMMSAGVPLVQSFEIVGKGHENPSMRDLIGQIKNSVESGGTLAEALREHPDYFDALFCNLVEAGEQGVIFEFFLYKFEN